jgi:hypothetical protein
MVTRPSGVSTGQKSSTPSRLHMQQVGLYSLNLRPES